MYVCYMQIKSSSVQVRTLPPPQMVQTVLWATHMTKQILICFVQQILKSEDILQ